jgi:hypothetical protein
MRSNIFLKEAKAASLQLRSPASGRGESVMQKLLRNKANFLLNALDR